MGMNRPLKMFSHMTKCRSNNMIKKENERFKKYMQKGIEKIGDMHDISSNLELITIWDWNHFLKVNLVMWIVPRYQQWQIGIPTVVHQGHKSQTNTSTSPGFPRHSIKKSTKRRFSSQEGNGKYLVIIRLLSLHTKITTTILNWFTLWLGLWHESLYQLLKSQIRFT